MSKRKFPASEGWLRMELEMRTSTPMSEDEIKELALMGRPADSREFGLVEQYGKKVKVIMRERKGAVEKP